MAEYKSFHYLMHEVPTTVKPVYVTGPAPLTFDELYSPRDGSLSLVHKSEKSYWRTRDRIEFAMYEGRKSKVMVITCYNVEKKENYRTIFLDLEVLYFEIEAKAQGNRDRIVKKKEQKLVNDTLHKAAAEFILARLNITIDPLPWPSLRNSIDEQSIIASAGVNSNDSADSATMSPVANQSSSEGATPAAESHTPGAAIATAEPHTERMCTFTKLSGDVFAFMEIKQPDKLKLNDLEHCKLAPTLPSAPTAVTTGKPEPDTDAGVPGTVAVGELADKQASLPLEGGSREVSTGETTKTDTNASANTTNTTTTSAATAVPATKSGGVNAKVTNKTPAKAVATNNASTVGGKGGTGAGTGSTTAAKKGPVSPAGSGLAAVKGLKGGKCSQKKS